MKLSSQPLAPSKLRENIYKYLDEVALKGKTIKVQRKGVILKIIPPEKKKKLSRFKKRNLIHGDPEELVHISWEKEWNPEPL